MRLIYPSGAVGSRVSGYPLGEPATIQPRGLMPKQDKNKSHPSSPATILNRKARYDYEILQTWEAGMVLVGSEVKSLYLGRANLTDGFCQAREGELWLMGLDIEPYDKAVHFSHERRRDRKLLMHRKEIELLARRAEAKGLAIIPLKIYFKNGKAKVEIALARGKRQYDKREKIAAKETRREIERSLGGRHG